MFTLTFIDTFKTSIHTLKHTPKQLVFSHFIVENITSYKNKKKEAFKYFVMLCFYDITNILYIIT